MKPEFISTLLDFRVVLKNSNYNSVHDSMQDSIHDGVYDSVHDTTQDKTLALLDFCEEPRSRMEMAAFMQIGSRAYFVNRYLKSLLAEGKLKMTLSDKPKSKNQKYVRVK